MLVVDGLYSKFNFNVEYYFKLKIYTWDWDNWGEWEKFDLIKLYFLLKILLYSGDDYIKKIICIYKIFTKCFVATVKMVKMN